MKSTPLAPLPKLVDYSALKANQICIVALLVIAFVFDQRMLVLIVGSIMLIGSMVPGLSLFKGLYLWLLKPLGIMKADPRNDDPAPHQFAQAFGGIFVLVAALALGNALATVGWVLVGVVVALASLNLFAGICVGCLMYFQFGRLGIPGFKGKNSLST